MRRISRDRINLRSGLIFACALDGPSDIVDLVTGDAPTVTGTPVTGTGVVRTECTTFTTANGYAWPVRSDLQSIRAMTITAWIRNNAVGADGSTHRTVVGIGNARFSCNFANSAAKLYWRSSSSSGSVISTSTGWLFVAGVITQFTNPISVPGNNRWSMVRDVNGARSEVDQALASYGDVPTSSSLVSIGAAPVSLNNVCIWSRALSHAEIMAASSWDLRR